MNDLINALQQVLPAVVKEWNEVKLQQFEQLFGQTFEKFFEGRQTQEKTKLVAPILDSVIARYLKEELPNFDVAEGKGQDYLYNNIPIESKITFGQGDSWTGNGYAKTPWHMLMRFEVLDNGTITRHFAMMVDMSTCKSQWTAPGTTSNFSTLKFVTEDYDNLIVATGSISRLTNTGKAGKYVRAIF